MEQIKHIRVAMICHFSNAEVRSHLPLDKRVLYTFMRRLLLMPKKGKTYGDCADWDVDLIDDFEKRPDVELHVISAHTGMKKAVVSYVKGKVHYFFVRCDRATMLKRLVKNDDLWRRLNPMVKDVHRLVNQINPDVVLLVGLENSHYSCTVLGIKDVPVYGLCQTIYNNPERALLSKIDSKNASTELKIFNEHKYFGVYCKKHYDLLRKIAPDDVQIFKFGFPSKGTMLEPTPTKKEYDFVNFAMSMSENKGFGDSIKALAIVKEKYPNVKLNLIGGGSAEQKEKYKQLAIGLGVINNVVFTPFFEKKSDLFLHIQKSRFALLPCKLDNTSGTMSQSMQLGLPLVVYKTTGTPGYNREKECALIAEHSNVEDLAAKMLMLMNDSELADKLRANAREYQEKRADYNRHNGERLVANLKAVVANYQFGELIPQGQLFDPEIDE